MGRMGQIDGVVVEPLVRHADDRGWFEEIIRVNAPCFTEGFGQWSHSKMFPGVVKGWHIHKAQIDWWYVPFGRIRAAMHDLRPSSATRGVTQELAMGDDVAPVLLKIPAGVAHGCKVIGEQPAHLFYITSKTYDPDEEGRIPHDDPEIGYDWLTGPPIK